MIKKIFLLYLLFFLSFTFAQSEEVLLNKVTSFSVDADDFVGTDNLEYYYYIKNNVFFKKKDAKIWQYQNIGLGKITKVDIINPLKIVVFYENFNKVVLLDNQLNEITTIDFSVLTDFIVARNVGMCGQNSLWIFNTMNQQLGLFNYETRKYMTLNQPLKNLFLNYQTGFNTFIWIDDKYQVFKMDIFGKLDVLDTVINCDDFQFISDIGVLFTKNSKLYLKKNNSKLFSELIIGEKRIAKFYFLDKILTIFTGKEIITYNLNLP